MNTNPKALFMAQYLGQKVSYGERRWTLVYSYRGEDKDKTIDLETAIGIGCALELRSVSDLTDGERRIIANLSYFGESTTITAVDQLFERYLSRQSVVTGEQWWFIQDYLRSIGILLPFTFISDGNPITLSTEEIIKNGWAIIRKDNGK